MDLCNLSVIRELMADAGITFRKDYGQNFLTNRMIPEEIAERCADDNDSLILEIGPGIGCLTQELAERYSRVVAVEIDRGLIPILDKTLADYDNITVINDDIMKLNITELVDKYSDGRSVSVCANLPYYITTPILMHLLESGVKFKTITVMVQNEVATRLCAPAGNSEYGAITAVLNYYGKVTRLFKVSAGCFVPAPKVDSAVIRIDLYNESPFNLKDERLFRSLIRAAFEMRRKTLMNAVSAKLPHIDKQAMASALTEIGHPENVRGERLTTEDFAKLANILSNNIYT